MTTNNQDWPTRVAPLRPIMFAHLKRLEYWSFATLLFGLALPIIFRIRSILMFGLVFAGWSAANIIIALLSRKAPPPRSVYQFAKLLTLNQFANAFYILIGIVFSALVGVADMQPIGVAILIQGIALFILDGRLLSEIRRLGKDE